MKPFDEIDGTESGKVAHEDDIQAWPAAKFVVSARVAALLLSAGIVVGLISFFHGNDKPGVQKAIPSPLATKCEQVDTRACEPGFDKVLGESQKCVPCRVDFVSDGATRCMPCPPGKVSNPKKTECVEQLCRVSEWSGWGPCREKGVAQFVELNDTSYFHGLGVAETRSSAEAACSIHRVSCTGYSQFSDGSFHYGTKRGTKESSYTAVKSFEKRLNIWQRRDRIVLVQGTNCPSDMSEERKCSVKYSLLAGQQCPNVYTAHGSDGIGAVVKIDGTVEVFGSKVYPPELKVPHDKIVDAIQVYSTDHAFAVLTSEESVVSWGKSQYGGGHGIEYNVSFIATNVAAIAVIKHSGDVEAWGDPKAGGDPRESRLRRRLYSRALHGGSNRRHHLSKFIVGTGKSFCALHSSGGTIEAWGEPTYGGVTPDRVGNITHVFSTDRAFAAIGTGETLRVFGNRDYGGCDDETKSVHQDYLDSFSCRPPNSKLPSGGIKSVYTNSYAFAIVMNFQSAVFVWGKTRSGGCDEDLGGSSSVMHHGKKITKKFSCKPSGLNEVAVIFSTATAFCALKYDGSLQVWGSFFGGGCDAMRDMNLARAPQTFKPNGYSCLPLLAKGAIALSVVANMQAFVVVGDDKLGIVAWGNNRHGGCMAEDSAADDKGICLPVHLQYKKIKSVSMTRENFASIDEHGNIESWGYSLGVPPQLTAINFSTFLLSSTNDQIGDWGGAHYSKRYQNFFGALDHNQTFYAWNSKRNQDLSIVAGVAC